MFRPAYRRGRPRRQANFRLSDEVLEILCAEAARRRMWASALVEELLRNALLSASGVSVSVAPESGEQGGTRPTRHWFRVALDDPIWRAMKHDADAKGVTVTQYIRQTLGELVNSQSGSLRESFAPPRAQGEALVSRVPTPPVPASQPAIEPEGSPWEPDASEGGVPSKPLQLFDLG